MLYGSMMTAAGYHAVNLCTATASVPEFGIEIVQIVLCCSRALELQVSYGPIWSQAQFSLQGFSPSCWTDAPALHPRNIARNPRWLLAKLRSGLGELRRKSGGVPLVALRSTASASRRRA